MIDIFIPSYHRPNNLKTVNYFKSIGYDMSKIHVFIDSEADDKAEYEKETGIKGFQLHVFDMVEARKRYDYVHRPSVSRRSAGQARNMFYDYAQKAGIDFFIMQDDDTQGYEIKTRNGYIRMADIKEILFVFLRVKTLMQKRKIGLFGLSQTGDFIGGNYKDYKNSLRPKVMNTIFVDTRFIYRGERGVQDDDTSQFINVLNEGLFTGSLSMGVVLKQTTSALQPGGLTDLYNECKLFNKACVTPVQFPSAIRVDRQVKNGNRVHHRINNRYLMPKLLKSEDRQGNIAWDTYDSDMMPFTCEPLNRRKVD